MSILDLLNYFLANPAWMYVLGSLLLLVIIIVTVAFIQGREISFWPPKISARQQKIGYSSTVQISEAVFKDALVRNDRQFRESELDVLDIQSQMYSKLSKEAILSIANRIEFEKRLFGLIVRINGHTAGMSHPKWRYYLRYDWKGLLNALHDPRIPQNLKQHIEDFFILTEPYLHGFELENDQFQVVKHLGMLILSELASVEKKNFEYD